jgi:hypothetical protein
MSKIKNKNFVTLSSVQRMATGPLAPNFAQGYALANYAVFQECNPLQVVRD